jgi:hypothetical protein
MKKLSMPVSKYFEFKQPKYIYLKLTPSTSIRNYSTDNLLKLIASLYRSFSQQISIINKKMFFECSAKVSFYIYMEKHRVEFFFIVPEVHYSLFKDKLTDTWSNKITISIVSEIPLFSHGCVKYYMDYKKEDPMSLVTDKRNNALLASELGTLYAMEDGDKAGVIFNFIPMDQHKWKADFENTIKRLKNDMPINKNKINFWVLLSWAIGLVVKAMEIGLESLSIGESDVKSVGEFTITDDTRNKKSSVVVGTQIICLSESDNKLREYNTAKSLCHSFQCLTSNDNELIGRRLRTKELSILSTTISKAAVLKMSPRETQHFISLPGLDLLEEHKIIDRLEVLEHEVPGELKTGIISLGDTTYKGDPYRAYLPTTKNERCLTVVLIGPTRSGKTTAISNFSNDARNGGECTIIFDFCGNCELSDSVNKDVGNVLNIDCSDLKQLQGMGYNEANHHETDPIKQYENAKIQASNLLALIDAVNSEDRDLKAKMNKYLSAAALLVFISNGKIKDVFGVLQDHRLRWDYINAVPSNQMEYMAEYIDTMKEIDDTKQGEVIGTKYNTAIGGIMDRVGQLKQNTYMELMLKKDCKNNFNLIDEMQNNQIICFRMPEHMFSTQAEKDAYCTYWMTKIWLALKFRKAYIPDAQHIKVNVIVDELSQVPHCQEFIRSKLSQMAKFNCKMIISCHYLNQIKIIREELKSANSSYMLISGCDKENYKELKEELAPYSVDDLLRLKKYHSLNLIKLPDGYVTFVTKLPKPL